MLPPASMVSKEPASMVCIYQWSSDSVGRALLVLRTTARRQQEARVQRPVGRPDGYAVYIARVAKRVSTTYFSLTEFKLI